jgi:mRNA interferase MazF
MVINQGDIYWIDFDEPSGTEPGYKHPHVVVQNNLFNRSEIKTVVVCALTSNLKRADAPGNILLEKKETHLPKDSVVNVSQIFTVDKSQLDEYVGTLSAKRVRELLNGVKLVLDPREPE